MDITYDAAGLWIGTEPHRTLIDEDGWVVGCRGSVGFLAASRWQQVGHVLGELLTLATIGWKSDDRYEVTYDLRYCDVYRLRGGVAAHSDVWEVDR